MPDAIVDAFRVEETENQGEDLLVLYGTGRFDPSYKIFVDRDSFVQKERGFEAKEYKSNTTVGFDFIDYQLELSFRENGRLTFAVEVYIHPPTEEAFRVYAAKRIREVAATRLQEVNYLPEIRTKKRKLGLVENVEGHIGTFITGKKGTIKQQKQKIGNNLAKLLGGTRRRRRS